MTFIETDHPRSRGKFTDKEQSAPETSLPQTDLQKFLAERVKINENAMAFAREYGFDAKHIPGL